MRWLRSGSIFVVAATWLALVLPANGQGLRIRTGTPVPIEVKQTSEMALDYLVKTQTNNGTWQNTSYGQGPGVDGICCLALLSSGEDPNYGIYADAIRKALRSIISKQSSTGLLSTNGNDHGSMYHHGFGTLALAEAYGAVDDDLLWKDAGKKGKTIGEALESAVKVTLECQDQNPYGGWRYTPDAKDADVSVSGANIVALLAAKNAGIEVPDTNMEKMVKLLEQSTDDSGGVAYQVGSVGFAFGDSNARTSIACLSLAIAKEKEGKAFKATIKYLSDRIDQPASSSWPYYTRYYQAQALFQGDFEAWEKWNAMNTEMIQQEQGDDGSIGGNAYSTGMSVLSMALNYRFLPIYER